MRTEYFRVVLIALILGGGTRVQGAQDAPSLLREAREKIRAVSKSRDVAAGWKVEEDLSKTLSSGRLTPQDAKSLERDLVSFRGTLVRLEIEAAPEGDVRALLRALEHLPKLEPTARFVSILYAVDRAPMDEKIIAVALQTINQEEGRARGERFHVFVERNKRALLKSGTAGRWLALGTFMENHATTYGKEEWYWQHAVPPPVDAYLRALDLKPARDRIQTYLDHDVARFARERDKNSQGGSALNRPKYERVQWPPTQEIAREEKGPVRVKLAGASAWTYPPKTPDTAEGVSEVWKVIQVRRSIAVTGIEEMFSIEPAWQKQTWDEEQRAWVDVPRAAWRDYYLQHLRTWWQGRATATAELEANEKELVALTAKAETLRAGIVKELQSPKPAADLAKRIEELRTTEKQRTHTPCLKARNARAEIAGWNKAIDEHSAKYLEAGGKETDLKAAGK